MNEDTQEITRERGCGKRKPGGLYLCTELSPFGEPLENFLFDPPQPTDMRPVRSPALIKGRDEKWHVVVWVGEEFYKHAADFIEEARVKGVSRRIPPSLAVDKLEQGSKMFFIHPKAVVQNGKRYPDISCPTGKEPHADCIGKAYQIANPDTEGGSTRTIVDVSYKVAYCGHIDPVFVPGFFLWTPITNIDYVKLQGGKVQKEIAKKADVSRLPFNFVDE